MEKISYQTKGVCSRAIELEIENGVIMDAQYIGGCHGNTQGISALVRGMRVEDAIERLSGIDCRGRGTSCPDQLARALREYLAKQ